MQPLKTFFQLAAISPFLIVGTASAQLVTPSGSVTAPDKGLTQNLSITSGSRTSLSVGNSTSFGASTNLNASPGLTGISRSVLIPSTIAIDSKIGDNAEGQTLINIANLTAKGNEGSISPSALNGSLSLAEGTQYASGDATVVGMKAAVNLYIDPTKGEASFFSTVHPNNYNNEACSPSSSTACAFQATTDLVAGNASSSANLSTTTNIDINANSFLQSFAQSF